MVSTVGGRKGTEQKTSEVRGPRLARNARLGRLARPQAPNATGELRQPTTCRAASRGVDGVIWAHSFPMLPAAVRPPRARPAPGWLVQPEPVAPTHGAPAAGPPSARPPPAYRTSTLPVLDSTRYHDDDDTRHPHHRPPVMAAPNPGALPHEQQKHQQHVDTLQSMLNLIVRPPPTRLPRRVFVLTAPRSSSILAASSRRPRPAAAPVA